MSVDDSGDFHLLITAAKDAADDAGHHRDYRGRYVHVGRGLIYACTALALSIQRFAAAIEPKEQKAPPIPEDGGEQCPKCTPSKE